MANPYHDFSTTINKHGFESLNESMGGLGDAIAEHFKRQRDQEQAVKSYIQQKELDNKYALELESGKNKLTADQNTADLENAKRMFPQMFGGQDPMVGNPINAQADFNPLKRAQSAVSSAVGGQSSPTAAPPVMNGAISNPVSSAAPDNPMKDYAFNPNRLLDKKAAMFVKNPDQSLKLEEKQQQFNQREWDKLVKEVNPLTTSGRNPLGMAMKANYNANRALSTLSNPMVTNQEAGNVMADIASIYQNGSPTQFGMSEQAYHTLYGKIASFKQFFTGKPQDALTPDVKNRLLNVLYDMKRTNFDVLKQNLAYTEKAKAKLIKSFPDEWKDMKETLMSDGYSGLGKQSGGGDMNAKMQQARDAGYSEEEIQKYLQGKM